MVDEIELRKRPFRTGLKMAGVLALAILFVCEMGSVARFVKWKRHWAALNRINDTIEALHCRKPAGISHHEWHNMLISVGVCTANALYVLDDARLNKLNAVLQESAMGEITLATPATWVRIMKEHCPQQSEYFENRLDSLGVGQGG